MIAGIEKVKGELTPKQIFDFLEVVGGDPQMSQSRDGDVIVISRTICHNPPHEGSHKLYYYDNTKLFKCWTECDEYFDIFQLVMKIQKCELVEAVKIVTQFFGLLLDFNNTENSGFSLVIPDWEIMQKRIMDAPSSAKKSLKIYSGDPLKFLPQPRILHWEKEGITYDVIKHQNIHYDPVGQGILIPHYNADNKLIGIRSRTLIKDNEEFGKYLPAVLNGKMYNHPLGFNLYNLNNSKNNISIVKKAILFEGEKSSLKYASFFGIDNDISVACCGSSLQRPQVKELCQLGCEEIIVAFDRQYQEVGDKEWAQWTKKLGNIYNKYLPDIKITFIFDKGHLLDYKDSPIDKGPEIFKELYENRVHL